MAVVESVNVMVSENTTTNNNNNNNNNNNDSPRQPEQDVASANGGTGGDEFKKEMRDLEEMLSKLNPLAEEFVPCKKVGVAAPFGGYGYAAVNNFLINNNSVYPSANQIRRV